MRKKRKEEEGKGPRSLPSAMKASVGLEGHLRRQGGGKGQRNQVHLLPPSLGKAPGMLRAGNTRSKGHMGELSPY